MEDHEEVHFTKDEETVHFLDGNGTEVDSVLDLPETVQDAILDLAIEISDDRGLDEPDEEPEEPEPTTQPVWLTLFGLALVLPIAVLRGWVAVKLWAMFGQPVWPNAWQPTIYTAVGVMLLVSMFQARPHVYKDREEPAGMSIIASLAWPLYLLGIGYLWHYLQIGA